MRPLISMVRIIASLSPAVQTELEAGMADGLNARNAGFPFEALVDIEDKTLRASNDSPVDRIGTEGLGELLPVE